MITTVFWWISMYITLLPQRVQLTLSYHWFRWCLGAKQASHHNVKIRKNILTYLWVYYSALWSFKMFTGHLFQIKLYLWSTVLLNRFQNSHEPGRYRLGKHNCLQNRANFHKYQTWQIVPNLNTAIHGFSGNQFFPQSTHDINLKDKCEIYPFNSLRPNDAYKRQ